MNRTRWIFIASILIALAAAVGYVLATPTSFESTGAVMLKRAHLERAGGASEDSKNRWVWVRDGLELKAELLSDAVVEKALILAGKEVGKIIEPGNTELVKSVKKKVTILYSGGDENIFTIKVKGENRKEPEAIVDAYLKLFPELATERHVKNLERTISELEKQLPKETTEGTWSKKLEILDTLKSDLAFAKAENNERIVVIEHPISGRMIWPRPIPIAAAFCLIALFMACLITAYTKKTKA